MRSPFCEASIVTHFLKVNRGQGIGAGEERAGPLNQMNNYCKTYEDRGQLPTISFLLPKNVLLDPSRILYLPMICQSDANLHPHHAWSPPVFDGVSRRQEPCPISSVQLFNLDVRQAVGKPSWAARLDWTGRPKPRGPKCALVGAESETETMCFYHH